LRKIILLAGCMLARLFAFPESVTAGTSGNQPEVIAALEARDRASIGELEAIIAHEKGATKGDDTFETNLRLAIFRMLFQNDREGLDHLVNGLVKFRFGRVLGLHIGHQR